jgi:hypothetical protein
MAPERKVTLSTQPPNRRLSSAERHAAQIASLSTKQAELKQEAAERRAERANQNAHQADDPKPKQARTARPNRAPST